MGDMSAYLSIFRLDTRARENFHEGQAFPAIILEVFKHIAMRCKILYRSYHFAPVKIVRLFVGDISSPYSSFAALISHTDLPLARGC